MKTTIRIAFAYFWPGFTPDTFRAMFPYLYEKYDVVPVVERPDIVFYSVFAKTKRSYADRHHLHPPGPSPKGPFVRVFLSGENTEPPFADGGCDFAVTFSRLSTHENHLRLPIWVYENRGWGYPPGRLIRDPATDWEQIAEQKKRFCNFVYTNPVPFRNDIFAAFSSYKHVDAAGRVLNNTGGAPLGFAPNRLAAKLDFLKPYKFTLAIENQIWPGYTTEKLVDPLFAHSIPIYVGDPSATLDFNADAYVDFARFANMKEMVEFVREIDNDRDLYLKMLSAPCYPENRVPAYALDETILAFFDRIVAAALARR